MVKGTTTQFKFSLPYDYSDIEVAKIKFWQRGNNGTPDGPLPIYKTLAHCIQTSNPREILVTLSPAETLRFSTKVKGRVQLSATTYEGIRFASKEQLITIYPIHDDTNIGDVVWPAPDESNGWVILDGEAIV
jgi:hypothetical protein